MNLEATNRIRNLLKPTVQVFKVVPNFKKVKNKFLKEILITKVPVGYQATLEFDHRYYEVDSYTSTHDESGSESLGITLSFVPKPHAMEKKNGGEHMISINFKMPKGKNLRLITSKNKNDLEIFFISNSFRSTPKWALYNFSKKLKNKRAK